MGNELISIVVPIYNVENYLRMCLDSIQNQTYQNFECLLINDGSPDHSSKICEEFVEKDSRCVEEVRNGNWTVAVLKLFKRELLQDLPFPIGKIAEDTYWTWKVLLRASRIVYLNRCVYWYRVGLSDTLSNTWSEKRMYDEIGAREEKIAILASSDYDLTNHILIYKNRLQRVIAKLEEQNMQFTEIYRRMMEKLSLLP
ncbi:glycosyltransferase [Streptococcus pneumoniae]|nr:glycosyltransferase [Streptococcus pneumoniae]